MDEGINGNTNDEYVAEIKARIAAIDEQIAANNARIATNEARMAANLHTLSFNIVQHITTAPEWAFLLAIPEIQAIVRSSTSGPITIENTYIILSYMMRNPVNCF